MLGPTHRQIRSIPKSLQESFEVNTFNRTGRLGDPGGIGPFQARIGSTLEPMATRRGSPTTYSSAIISRLKVVPSPRTLTRPGRPAAVVSNLAKLKLILEEGH